MTHDVSFSATLLTRRVAMLGEEADGLDWVEHTDEDTGKKVMTNVLGNFANLFFLGKFGSAHHIASPLVLCRPWRTICWSQAWTSEAGQNIKETSSYMTGWRNACGNGRCYGR